MKFTIIYKMIFSLMIFLLILNSFLLFVVSDFAFTGFLVRENKGINSNFINLENIEVYEDKIIIRIANASLSSYNDSGSMSPILNKYSTGIKIKPFSEEQVNKGDIVVFREEDSLVVHRVVKKGIDKKGVYFITKGDNNFLEDGKIRFSEIEYVVVGVLY